MKEVQCKTCKEWCPITGDIPKVEAWCSECNDYADGFRPEIYVADKIADTIDRYRDKIKYGELD